MLGHIVLEKLYGKDIFEVFDITRRKDNRLNNLAKISNSKKITSAGLIGNISTVLSIASILLSTIILIK